MKKALILVIFTAAALAAAAQQYKGNIQIDSLFTELEGIGLPIWKAQTSNKRNWGVTVRRSVSIERYADDWWQSIMSSNSFPSQEVRDSVEANLKGRMARQNPMADRALALIQDALDKMCRLAKECYVVRSRTDGVDSVAYSICLSLFNDTVNNTFMSTSTKQKLYLNAKEMVYFQYNFVEKEQTWMGYLSHIVVPTDSIVLASAPFDHKAFAVLFDKAMKRKGFRRRPVHWVFNEQYDTQPDIEPDVIPFLNSGITKRVDGKYVKVPGEVYGTVYSVPASDKALANAMLELANDVALTYVNQHPKQDYSYKYDIDYYRPFTESQSILFCLGNGQQTHIFPIEDDEGYHIVCLNSKGAMFVPVGFARLKEYKDGKKTLYK